MKISDEKRREVANHLRKLSETDSFIGELKPSDELYDCMCLMAIRATVGKGDIFERLAELIDRPTCRIVHDESRGCDVCTNCLTAFELAEFDYADANVFEGYSYCSKCGAEVVGDED